MISVEWKLAARDELDAIWAAADVGELPALERLVVDLLTDLRDDPLGVGESRTGVRRVVVRSPLTVWFEVLDDARRVRIYHIRRPARRA